MIVMMQPFALALSCVFAIRSGPVIAGQSTVAKGDRVDRRAYPRPGARVQHVA